MLTKDGRMKIVDVGPAQGNSANASGNNPGSTLTLVPDGAESDNITKAGAVLGTARYLSLQ